MTSFADQTRETFKKLGGFKKINRVLTYPIILEKRIAALITIRSIYVFSIIIGILFVLFTSRGCTPNGNGSQFAYQAEAAAYHAKKLHRCVDYAMSREICYNDFVNSVDPYYDLPRRASP